MVNKACWTRIVSTVAFCAGAAIAAASDPTPTPTRTPVSGSDATLSDVAGTITLDKDALASEGGIVISDENLERYAGEGRLTEVTKPGQGAGRRGLADVTGTGGQIEGQAPGFGETEEKKQYWQAQYARQLDLVTEIRDQIDILDYEIPGLWRDFYAWDDPMYRDGVIKPKLDQALAKRQKLETDLQRAEADLSDIKLRARRDGAQPGWFRGFDKPPTPKPTAGVMPP